MNDTVKKKAVRKKNRIAGPKSAVAESGNSRDSAVNHTTDPSSATSYATSDAGQSANPETGLTMHRPVPTDWDDHAICRFFNEYTLGTSTKLSGYMDFLPDMYSKIVNAPYLTESIRALSLASLANQQSMPDLAIRGREAYGTALIKVNKALFNEEEARRDEVLATLYLLSKYEVCP